MPLIGDETAHYYIAVNQSHDFSKIAPKWELTTDYGETRAREGTNTPGWYLICGFFYRLLPFFATIQLIHLLFFVQLLLFFYWLSRRLSHNSRLTSLTALFCLGTIAMFNLFGVAMYLDVPMTAQIVTAIFLFSRRAYLPGIAVFMFALFIKENALLFIPPAMLFIAINEWKRPWKIALPCAGLAAGTILILGAWDWIIFRNTGLHSHTILSLFSLLKKVGIIDNLPPVPAGEPPPDIIVYPGDLRLPINWLIYPGMVFWLFAASGVAGLTCWILRYGTGIFHKKGFLMAALTGGFYLVVGTIMIRPNLDIRYLLPGVPFIVFCLACGCVRIKYFKYILPLFLAAGILQVAAVMLKISQLRTIEPELQEIIACIKASNSPKDSQLLMYADKWRFMPLKPEWQISSQLWNASVSQIDELLRKHRIAFVVVDKSKLVKKWSAATANAMPSHFVELMNQHPDYFSRLIDNRKYSVYKVSP